MTLKYSRFNSTPYEVHMLVLEKIREGSRVLDVGCASGYFAKELKRKRCYVWGVEKEKKAGELAKKHCEEVIIGDVEKMKKLKFEENFFDYILLLDVLEHVREPVSLVRLVKPYLKKKGKIIISVPNIAFISIRLSLLLGNFQYKRLGIMDGSHLRFFTKKSLFQFVKGANLKIEEFDASCGFSQITKVGSYLNRIPKYCQYKLTRLYDTLLAYQFIVVCNKL